MNCYYCNSKEHEDTPCPARINDANLYTQRGEIIYPKAKVVHCKKEKFDIYIGRPSKWGNPYSHINGTLAKYKVSTREEAIEKYEEYIRNTPDLFAAIPELKGKVLGCWCKPLSCHGDVLLKLVSEVNLHLG